MRREEVAGCVVLALLLAAAGETRAQTATTPRENFAVRTFVPTFSGTENLGANVSTILALRLWATLRPVPRPNPRNLYFGVGQIEWSTRTIEDSPAAMRAASETESQIVLWGDARQYGPGVIVASNIVVPRAQGAARAREMWNVPVRGTTLELGLPNIRYQFSPLIISNEVVAKYSRPNQIRICETKVVDCAGRPLGSRFTADRIEGDFAHARQPNGSVGWVLLPNLSPSQSEVVGFTAALISYVRGDFEQAEAYFAVVRDGRPLPRQDTRDYRSDSLVGNDATLLAAISRFRRGAGIDGLRAAHAQNPYSRYGVQALVMADLATADAAATGDGKESHLAEARELVESYRHLFPPDDPWLSGADQSLRSLN
jgi:hypothetical protein